VYNLSIGEAILFKFPFPRNIVHDHNLRSYNPPENLLACICLFMIPVLWWLSFLCASIYGLETWYDQYGRFDLHDNVDLVCLLVCCAYCSYVDSTAFQPPHVF